MNKELERKLNNAGNQVLNLFIREGLSDGASMSVCLMCLLHIIDRQQSGKSKTEAVARMISTLASRLNNPALEKRLNTLLNKAEMLK